MLIISRHKNSAVLGCPARGTGAGGGHHDGCGLGSPTHGAGDVLVVVARDCLILHTIEVASVLRFRLVVKFWRHGQTKSVGCRSSVREPWASSNSCRMIIIIIIITRRSSINCRTKIIQKVKKNAFQLENARQNANFWRTYQFKELSVFKEVSVAARHDWKEQIYLRSGDQLDRAVTFKRLSLAALQPMEDSTLRCY